MQTVWIQPVVSSIAADVNHETYLMHKMKNIAIISTGSELVHGKIHEANAFFISNCLFKTAFDVRMHLTVGDSISDLEYAVTQSMLKADIIIMTGGLGPTEDDYTLEVLQRIFKFDTEIHKPSKDKMDGFFSSIGRETRKGDIKQVTVPRGAHVFFNNVGLAAGYACSYNGKVVIAMPGVPAEMHLMFEKEVMPYLLDLAPDSVRQFLTFRLILMGESEVNSRIMNMDIDFSKVDWGITTGWGMNTVTFLQKGEYDFNKEIILKHISNTFQDRLLELSSPDLESETIELLRKKRKVLAAAESCTGGLVAKRLTDIPGASDVFAGGVTAYSNDLKINILGVSAEALNAHGAVSSVVAEQMAEGIRKISGADIGISLTGIAGPSGGTPDKPVGLVYFGFSLRDRTESFSITFKFDRERVRYFASQYALDYVRLYLKNL